MTGKLQTKFICKLENGQFKLYNIQDKRANIEQLDEAAYKAELLIRGRNSDNSDKFYYFRMKTYVVTPH